jgi:uncharacterized surface protein with fasciclin (FAS1) repeats
LPKEILPDGEGFNAQGFPVFLFWNDADNSDGLTDLSGRRAEWFRVLQRTETPSITGDTMRRTKQLMAALAAAAVVATTGVWAAGVEEKAGKNIVETAVAAGQFSTLVKAVKAADLAETLQGEGPFTVFAPTDEAFAKVPKEQLDALLKDKKALAAVLTYHVVPGKVTAADVVKIDSAKTVEGHKLNIKTKQGTVMINNAKVIKADIMCSNGVIHVIDAVLLPPKSEKK